MKNCPACKKLFPEEYIFCPVCGGELEDLRPKDGPETGGFTIGDANVVAGDIVKTRKDYHVSGDATFVEVTDPAKETGICSVCGKNMLLTEGYTCPVCGKLVCADDYRPDQRKCLICAEKADRLPVVEGKDLSLTDEIVRGDIYDGLLEVEPDSSLLQTAEELYHRRRDNPAARAVYYDVLAEISPEDLLTRPAGQFAGCTDLEILTEVLSRQKAFGKAEAMLSDIAGTPGPLGTCAAECLMNIYIDILNWRPDQSIQRQVEHAAASLDAYGPGGTFLTAYLGWSTAGESLFNLWKRLEYNKEHAFRLWRKRKTLLSLLSGHAKQRLVAANLVCRETGKTVPLYFSAYLGRSVGPLENLLRDDPAVSRKHALFKITPELTFFIKDLDSKNGTFHNGKRLEPGKETEVFFGDSILLGKKLITLRESETTRMEERE